MKPLTDVDRTVLKIALRELLRDSRASSKLSNPTYQAGLLLMGLLNSGTEFFIETTPTPEVTND